MNNIFDSGLTQRHPFAVSMISGAVQKDRLGHAYILTGRAEDDKWLFARQLSAFLNCELSDANYETRPCHLTHADTTSYCLNCRWIHESKHPQAFLALTSEGSKSGKIAVDKARQLSEELSKCSDFFRTIVVEDASQEKFHRPAANALLKTIESPGERCLFLLFASREEEVLPTVVSRCQVTPMQNKEVEESVLWLVVNNRKAEVGSTEEHFQLVRQSFEKTFGSKDSRDTVRALDFAFDMQSAHDESDHNSSIIDFALKLEIARVGARSIGEKRFAAYLADLLSLAEEAKLQIEQYVSSKAVIETFVLSWWQLRQTCGC